MKDEIIFEELNLDNVFVEKKALTIISYYEAIKNKVLPISIKKGLFCITTSNPRNNLLIQKIKEKYSFKLKIYTSQEGDIVDKIEREYRLEDNKESMDLIKSNLSDSNFFDDRFNISVNELLDEIINQAILFGASDIHIEPMSENSRIRFRIDGILKTIDYKNKKTHKLMIGRIKILSKLNIAETKKPQDGRITYKRNENVYDLRVSMISTVYGEKVVIRILKGRDFEFSMDDIGFDKEHISILKNTINSGYGMILICGPTGSGKTSTLYSMVKEASDKQKNIVSIEDPPEYIIEGMSQMQVMEKRGIDFANGLRAILRQDPDVIMIGEIRDEITANIAIKAASTGHLILSSIHTANAISAISRIMDMDIKSYQVSEALKIIISQRLILKICPNCKSPYTASDNEKEELKISNQENLILYKGLGCKECFQTGYKGRQAVYEFLEIDDYIKSNIKENLQLEKIYMYQKSKNFKTFNENTRQLVLLGKTSIDEYLKNNI